MWNILFTLLKLTALEQGYLFCKFWDGLTGANVSLNLHLWQQKYFSKNLFKDVTYGLPALHQEQKQT